MVGVEAHERVRANRIGANLVARKGTACRGHNEDCVGEKRAGAGAGGENGMVRGKRVGGGKVQSIAALQNRARHREDVVGML